VFLPGLAGTASASRRAIAAQPGDSVVIRWNNAVLQGVRDSRLGPPMVARALAIAHTCMYDAWAAYDRKAVGTSLGGSLRRPPAEHTVTNVNQAIDWSRERPLARRRLTPRRRGVALGASRSADSGHTSELHRWSATVATCA